MVEEVGREGEREQAKGPSYVDLANIGIRSKDSNGGEAN